MYSLPPGFPQGLDGFLRVLATLGFQPRTLGSTDYPSKAPLDEVIDLMNQCRGAIILGYPPLTITAGTVKDKAIDRELLLPTEWNHIEAGLAYTRGLPLLVIHHEGVGRGIVDRGALAGFLHGQRLDDPTWPLRQEIQGALAKWNTDVLARSAAPAVHVKAADPPSSTAISSQRPSQDCRNCGAVPGKRNLPSSVLDPQLCPSVRSDGEIERRTTRCQSRT
jgi:hypothetical protein